MYIGNLPQGNDPSQDDVIVFSKDGQHLLKIKYSDFIREIVSKYPQNYVASLTYTNLVETQDKVQIGTIIVNEVTQYPVYVPNSIITGSTVPDNNTGSDGNLYFLEKSGKMFKYIKFEITARKGTGNYTQLSEFKLVDGSSNAYDFDGIVAKANKPLYRYDQKNENMFDGFTATKALWVATPTTNDPITVVCTLFEPIDISVYNTLQLWTGNDAEERDPQGWIISVSNDKINWTVVNQETNYTMTSSRSALGYSHALTLPANNTVITQRYFKESGHWIPILN